MVRWQGSRPCWAQRAMVLGETCKMAATWADRRKVATLGAGRGDWLCIGTSFDAQGCRGRVTAPGPDLSDAGSRVLRGPHVVTALLGLSAGACSAALVGRSGTLGSRG